MQGAKRILHKSLTDIRITSAEASQIFTKTISKYEFGSKTNSEINSEISDKIKKYRNLIKTHVVEKNQDNTSFKTARFFLHLSITDLH